VAIRRVQFSFDAYEGHPKSVGRATLVGLLLMLVAATTGSIPASSVAAQNSSESSRSPSTPPAPPSSVEGYGDHDKLCLAWNDGCVTCQRDAAAGAACSNIGIACQPKEIACTKRQPEK
jgi:hypothetical protein